MWFWRKKNRSSSIDPKVYYPIDISLDQMKHAVREFEKELPKGVSRRVLVKEDNSIDSDLLKAHLEGIPVKKYYMSKETYEIFEDHEKQIPFYLDLVQTAVDNYVRDEKHYPVSHDTIVPKINYDLLVEKSYLKEKPPFALYLTKEENLLTHKKPQR
ncbi:MAG: hypothetical protein A2189_02415 [Paenibacillus sp. RIFOXYA1_FULL_44_5]|nr:MAG: hypothetical protein A2189_02415 [Paenibacillus sp. RIFOXYA1_FULL_44_5]